MSRASRRPDSEWLRLTAASAVVVTALDAVLLQLRRDYFTGGFLSVDAATSWADRALFLVASLLTDAAVVGLGVAVALLIAGALRLPAHARRFLGLALGAGPWLLGSLVEYQVFTQLGDGFDVGLALDLVGRRPAELFAVASAHLWLPLGFLVLLIAGVIGAAWWLTRRWPGGARAVSTASVLVGWLGLAMIGLVAMAACRVVSDVQDNGLRRKPAGQALGTIVEAASDVDRDGYGLLGRPPDPAVWDGRVYPYALDVPGNGIDEDGVAGDLVEGAPYREAPAPSAPFVRTPDVVVVMLETFRADLLGLRHDGREVTPVLNALARDGAAADRAYSHNGYTVQSRYHFFTGSLAGLREGTLIDDFKANGYEVAYFSAQDESFGGPRFDVGLDRVDTFYDARQDEDRRYTTFATSGSLGVSSDVLLERVEAFLASRQDGRPLFLYVNLYDTHFPYHHDGMADRVSAMRLAQGDITPARRADLEATYRNAAAHVDAAVGRLLGAATSRLGRRPAVVVLADHGESLFDEGFLGHGYALDEVQTRIPLVVNGLGVELCEPLGQADLRDGITDALTRADDRPPSFRPCADARVFQYLGLLYRPPQIGVVTAGGRLAYDFRRREILLGDRETAQAPESAEDATRDAWLELVRCWERMRLAQVEAGQR